MWELLPRNTRLTIVVLLVVYAGWVVSHISQLATGTPESTFKSASTVTAIIGVGLVAVVGLTWRRIWRRAPILNRWFPDLTGRWEGTYVSSYKYPDTGLNATGPIKFTIRQGLFSTSVTGSTGEMRSYSSRSWLEADREAQRFRLGYTYTSEPNAAVRHRSAPHEGVCWLTMMLADDSDRLKGIYYTERRSIGDLDLKRLSRDPEART
jgi:hypothetical protein